MFLLNGNPVVFGEFPNGEMNLDIQIMDIKHTNSITWHYEGDHEIFQLQMLKMYLDDQGTRSRIYIGYLPFSRMDRTNSNYGVTLRAITKIINDLGFVHVRVREPHSDVSMVLLDRAKQHDWCKEMLMNKGFVHDYDTICFPDAGAMKRYAVVDTKRHLVAWGEKDREFSSGDIIGLKINGDVGKKVLIVDDLCSRGGTFIEAAQILDDRGAESVSLLVAHCEPNVFTGDLFDHIDMLYTSPEMLKKDVVEFFDKTKQITFLEN